MRIIVDTCIWSLALRRSGNDADPTVIALAELIKDTRIQMLGPYGRKFSRHQIRGQFKTISGILRAFPDIPLQNDDYELAAKFLQLMPQKGHSGFKYRFSHLCSVWCRRKMPIFFKQ